MPRDIRHRLGLGSGDKLAFKMLREGAVVMRAKTLRLMELPGSLTRHGQPRLSDAQMTR